MKGEPMEYRHPELKRADPTLVSDHLAQQGISTTIRHEEGDAMYITPRTKGIGEAKLARALAGFKP